MKRAAAVLLAVLALARLAAAAPPILEINGREFFGTVFQDRGELYGPLDVVGPLLVGPEFVLDNYDIVQRKATFRWLPAGATQTVKGSLTGCMKRGAAVYGPIKAFTEALGASFALDTDAVRLAYPPVSASPPVPVPSPTTVVVRPPTPSTPTIVVAPAVDVPPSPEIALAEAQAANQEAFATRGAIRRIEVYHPVQPDPADAIPRTDLAGLKIYVAGLKADDEAAVTLWSGRQPQGAPQFERKVRGFGGQDLLEGSFFVRLPLKVAAGWHTVRVAIHGEQVDYRFVTY